MNHQGYTKYGYCKGINTETGNIIYGYFAFLPYTTYCFKEDYEAHPENDKEYIITYSMTDWGLPNNIKFHLINPGSMRPYLGQDKNGMLVFHGDRIRWFADLDGKVFPLYTTIFLSDWKLQVNGNKVDFWNKERQIWLSDCELTQDGLQEEN